MRPNGSVPVSWGAHTRFRARGHPRKPVPALAGLRSGHHLCSKACGKRSSRPLHKPNMKDKGSAESTSQLWRMRLQEDGGNTSGGKRRGIAPAGERGYDCSQRHAWAYTKFLPLTANKEPPRSQAVILSVNAVTAPVGYPGPKNNLETGRRQASIHCLHGASPRFLTAVPSVKTAACARKGSEASRWEHLLFYAVWTNPQKFFQSFLI